MVFHHHQQFCHLIWHQNLKTFRNLKNEGPQQITLIKKPVQVWLQVTVISFLYISLSTPILKIHTYTHTKPHRTFRCPETMKTVIPVSVKNRVPFFMWTSPPAQLCIRTHCPHSASVLVPCTWTLPASPVPTLARACANEFPSWSQWHCTFHVQSQTKAFPNRGSFHLVSQTCTMREWKWRVF